jgi:hypothetical protein
MPPKPRKATTPRPTTTKKHCDKKAAFDPSLKIK